MIDIILKEMTSSITTDHIFEVLDGDYTNLKITWKPEILN